MFRHSSRHLLAVARPRQVPRSALSRRFLSTAPPHEKSRSWKNSFGRWALAGGLVYYYNTSSAFADEPTYTVHAPPETRHENEQEAYQSIDEIAAERQARKQVAAATPPESADVAVAGSPDDLEAEADQQGAFNEETGEINWDCPCLGGMAHGPCGEQFREAFSCFVFSKEEPKGVDCIDKFKGMQDCFRAHPEIYGSELEDDEDPELVGEEGPGQVPAGAEAGVGAATTQTPQVTATSEAQAPVVKAAPETNV
ncbi:Mitochondrial intermembrane space import and assembly protein 40 [Elsinoe australis]|uniref:Mitochondrial intermembrane space import and assembly protein 40 n=1 Tax=Elsinoe australis TaxID=40998 RepID=A0A2P7YJF7_9PEZI|nr:Mitochondrial intermembrane space import and assembly protein 40 [Elsinoe australis]